MKLTLATAAALISALTAGSALAHTGSTSASGLALGIGHPLSGPDHLIAMFAVGLVAAQVGGRALWQLPLAFMGAMVLGAALAGIGGQSPFVETGIALSIVALGAMLMLGRSVRQGLGGALVAFFALFHGHAHMSEVLATAASMEFAAGFLIATGTLHLAGIGLGLGLKRTGKGTGLVAGRLVGVIVVIPGFAILTGAV